MIADAPTVMLGYQQTWLEDTARVRLIEKSRRIGISWATAAEVVIDAASKNGTDAWYIGYNRDMAVEFIRDCAQWARFVNEAAEVEEVFEGDDEDKSVLSFVLRFASGFRVTALSSRPTNLRGKRGHIVIDEAAFHDDLPGLIKAAMAVIMWGGRNRVDIISTHNGVDNAFNFLVEEVKAGKREGFAHHRVTLTEALEQGLFKRICLVNGWTWTPELEQQWTQDLRAQYGDDAEEELDCVPARSGGTYLHRRLVERAMFKAPVIRLELEDAFVTWTEEARAKHADDWCERELKPLLEQLDVEKLHFLGEDFGRTSDRTVLYPGYLDQDLTRVFPFVVEMLNVPFEQQRQVAFYVIDRLPKRIGVALDATGNGAYLAEACALRYNGAEDPKRKDAVPHVQQVKLTEQWYAEHLPPLKAAFEDELIRIPRDADHLIDLAAFKVVNGLPKLPKLKTAATDKTKKPRHGDAAVALLLAHYASRMPVAEYAYQPVRRYASPRPHHASRPAPTGLGSRGRRGVL